MNTSEERDVKIGVFEDRKSHKIISPLASCSARLTRVERVSRPKDVASPCLVYTIELI